MERKKKEESLGNKRMRVKGTARRHSIKEEEKAEPVQPKLSMRHYEARYARNNL